MFLYTFSPHSALQLAPSMSTATVERLHFIICAGKYFMHHFTRVNGGIVFCFHLMCALVHPLLHLRQLFIHRAQCLSRQLIHQLNECNPANKLHKYISCYSLISTINLSIAFVLCACVSTVIVHRKGIILYTHSVLSTYTHTHGQSENHFTVMS